MPGPPGLPEVLWCFRPVLRSSGPPVLFICQCPWLEGYVCCCVTETDSSDSSSSEWDKDSDDGECISTSA